MPPASTTSPSPHLIAWAPRTTASMPEAHNLFTVVALVSLEIPAPIIACRQVFWPWPMGSTLPI